MANKGNTDNPQKGTQRKQSRPKSKERERRASMGRGITIGKSFYGRKESAREPRRGRERGREGRD